MIRRTIYRKANTEQLKALALRRQFGVRIPSQTCRKQKVDRKWQPTQTLRPDPTSSTLSNDDMVRSVRFLISGWIRSCRSVEIHTSSLPGENPDTSVEYLSSSYYNFVQLLLLGSNLLPQQPQFTRHSATRIRVPLAHFFA